MTYFREEAHWVGSIREMPEHLIPTRCRIKSSESVFEDKGKTYLTLQYGDGTQDIFELLCDPQGDERADLLMFLQMVRPLGRTIDDLQRKEGKNVNQKDNLH